MLIHVPHQFVIFVKPFTTYLIGGDPVILTFGIRKPPKGLPGYGDYLQNLGNGQHTALAYELALSIHLESSWKIVVDRKYYF